MGRSGQALTLNGSPWRFIAYNDYQLTSMPNAAYCGRALDQATLNSIMQDAKASGANVIRTWFFQSYYDMSNANGSWQEVTPTYAAFDRVLNAAAANGLKELSRYSSTSGRTASRRRSIRDLGSISRATSHPVTAIRCRIRPTRRRSQSITRATRRSPSGSWATSSRATLRVDAPPPPRARARVRCGRSPTT